MSAKTDCTKVVLNLVAATGVVVVVGVPVDKAIPHLPLLLPSYNFLAPRIKLISLSRFIT